MQDRKNTRNLITEILNNINIEKFTPIPDNFFSQISSLDSTDSSSDQLITEIYNHIFLLRVMIDINHNIQSKLITLQNDKKIYIRHAQLDVILKTEFNEKKIAAYNYLRIFYAYLLAAIAIGKIYRFDNLHFAKSLNHIKIITTNTFFANLECADDELIFRYLAEAKGDLINLVHVFHSNFDHVAINYMLDHAKDWVALDEPTIPVCTVINTNADYSNKTIIILDEACSQLTQDQLDLFSDLPNQTWFEELDSFQQNLVMHYKTRILTGLSVIPSRLRGIIPLNKNAFKESVCIAATPDDVEIINTCYHTGTVAHVSHKNELIATNISRFNMMQQKLVCNADAMVMICLNSQKADRYINLYEWFNGREFVTDDSEIIKLTHAAALQLTDEKIFYAKICLNAFRMIEDNDYSGIDVIISVVNENLSKLDSTLPWISRLTEVISKFLNQQRQFTPIDYYVKGLDIIHLLTQIAARNNELVEEFSERDLKKVAIWFGCASGENRTGITYYHNICVSIIDYFNEMRSATMNEQSKMQVFEMIAKSQHLLVMTGHQGNTFGTDGIRRKSSGSLKDYHPKLQLLTKTSDIKSIPAFDASFNAMLDRLAEVFRGSEVNSTFKHLIPLARQYFDYASNQRSCIVFFSYQVKNIYIDIMHALERLLVAPVHSSILNNLLKIQKSLSLVLSNHIKSLEDNLLMLNSILTRIINETRNLIKLIPSEHEQLAKHGFFKSYVCQQKLITDAILEKKTTPGLSV